MTITTTPQGITIKTLIFRHFYYHSNNRAAQHGLFISFVVTEFIII